MITWKDDKLFEEPLRRRWVGRLLINVPNDLFKLWIAFSSNSMQPDAKVEKKCATSYLIDDMILKSILPFLPIISDRDEVKGHVILAKTCYFWMILKIRSTFYEIPSNAIKWIEMTIFSGKFFTFVRHENWVS